MRFHTRLFPTLLVGALFTGLAPGTVQAGGTAVDPNPGPVFIPPLYQASEYDEDSGGNSANVGEAVYNTLTAASAFCAALADDTYQIDCLSERLNALYRSIPDGGPYDETKAALRDASIQLRAVVEQYRDPSKDGKTFATASGSTRTTRRLQPVAPARQAAAIAQAVAIVEQAETVLLRSSSTSAEAGPQIERIAAAVGSNKVLLRST